MREREGKRQREDPSLHPERIPNSVPLREDDEGGYRVFKRKSGRKGLEEEGRGETERGGGRALVLSASITSRSREKPGGLGRGKESW